MRHIRHLLSTLIMLLFCVAVSAHDFEVDGIFYKIISYNDLTVSVTYEGDYHSSSSDEYSGVVNIPSFVTHIGKTYSVIRIENFSFSGCSNLTSVTISEGVMSIGHDTFWGCSSLTSVTIPEGVTSIEYEAFYGCSNLTSITIPESVTSIGYSAFSYCSSLTSINLPEDLTMIEHGAFYKCSNLTSITIPKSVTSIGSDAFCGCSKSLTSIIVAEGNNVYDSRNGCNAIIGTNSNTLILGCTTTVIPESVTSIGFGAFSGCSSLAAITIPESVTSIGDCAFSGCSSLAAITIPESVTSIGYSAFSYCSSLTSIIISEGVTSIGSSAFSGCSNLTSITIPKSVTSIGPNAFGECSNSLTSIIVAEGNNDYDSRNGCNAIIETNSNTLIFGCTTTTIPESVTSIGDNAFWGCSNLTSITLPESVTIIKYGAFYGCSSLTSICLPENVMSIGSNAFSGCDGLTSITIPESVTRIGERAFSSCSSLNSVTLPKEISSIESQLFYQCSSLTSVTIPESVTSIESYAFFGCSSLTSVTIFGDVSSVGESVFANCGNIKIVNCYGKVSSLMLRAFENIPRHNAILYVLSKHFDYYKNMGAFKNIAIKLANLTYMVDGEVYSTQEVACGDTLVLTDEPVKEGHTFSGWSEAPEIMPLDSVVVKGAFTPNTYKVTYTVYGEVYHTDSVVYGTVITPPNSPTHPDKESLGFKGWLELPDTMPAHDVVAIATFSDSYRLTYTVDNEDYYTEIVACGAKLVPIPEPIKEGYSFSGWIELPDTMPESDLIVSGVFTINKYQVDYMVDGDVYCIDSVTYNTAIKLIDEPTREGYSFSGWSEAPDSMPAHNIQVEGSFAINSYKLTYMVDGEEYYTDSLVYGTAIIAPEAPVKEGYTFDKWVGIRETMPGEDLMMSASYIINSYRITYTIDGEEYYADSIVYNKKLTLIDEPTKEGYTFSGWSEIPEIMPARDILVEGTFAINSYQVTYMVDGDVYQIDSIAYNTAFVLIDEPIKEGYTFSGWSKTPTAMPANDLVVSGTFAINTYRVTYMIDSYVYRTDSLQYGAAITPPDAPTSPGYTFSGWSEFPATMPAYDLVITGMFFGSGLASIYTDEQGIVYNLNDDKDAYVVAGVTNTLTNDIVIPDIINEAPVTAINDKVFVVVESIHSVVIPASVTSVGNMAFYGCKNLLLVEWNTTAPVRADCFDKAENHGNMLVFVNDADTEVSYKGNVIVEGVAEQITISDDMAFRSPQQFTARNISFTRNLNKKTKIGVSGGWEAMVLPFDVQSVVSKNRGELKPFGEADFTTSLPFWLGELQADGTFAAAQSIKANKPFIMQLPNSDEYEDRYNVEGEVTFSATDVTVLPTTDMEQEAGNGYVMLGSYEGTTADSRVYALNDEEYIADGDTYMPGGVFVANSRDIRPFEAYVYTTNAGRAPYLRIGKETTGVVLSTVNGQQTTEIYDLTGRKVLNVENLKGGIYIVNGRKVVIK